MDTLDIDDSLRTYLSNKHLSTDLNALDAISNRDLLRLAKTNLDGPDYFSSRHSTGLLDRWTAPSNLELAAEKELRSQRTRQLLRDIEHAQLERQLGSLNLGESQLRKRRLAANLVNLELEDVNKRNLEAQALNAILQPGSKYTQIHPQLCSDGRYPLDFERPLPLEWLRSMRTSQLDRILSDYRLPAPSYSISHSHPHSYSHSHSHIPHSSSTALVRRVHIPNVVPQCSDCIPYPSSSRRSCSRCYDYPSRGGCDDYVVYGHKCDHEGYGYVEERSRHVRLVALLEFLGASALARRERQRFGEGRW